MKQTETGQAYISSLLVEICDKAREKKGKNLQEGAQENSTA